MARSPRTWQPPLVMLVVLPFWTSFLIRIYAWINILQREGRSMRPCSLARDRRAAAWLASDTAIYIGIVYSYLPFMVLPLYATLEKMDETLLEAAADLGAPRWKAFWLVTVPLSLPGVAAGRIAVLHPDRRRIRHPRPARRLGDIDDRAGAVDRILSPTRDWPVASAVAVVLLGLLARADPVL